MYVHVCVSERAGGGGGRLGKPTGLWAAEWVWRARIRLSGGRLSAPGFHWKMKKEQAELHSSP